MNRDTKIIVFIIILFILLKLVAYTVDETEQAIVRQFGEPKRTITEPGLKFKLPWPIQNVIYFDKRVLDYDAAARPIITKDKKNLEVDNYAKWQIIDPLEFYKSVVDERGAQLRLDDIIYSELREALGLHTLDEIVTTERFELMEMVTKASDSTARRQLGVSVIDVRIKRADLPEENAQAVYQRMRAERKVMANKYRSEGEEEALKIRAVTDSLKVVYMANAYKRAKILRGTSEARAIEIYADAFNRDPEFYEFYRTLEAYKSIIDTHTVILLPPDSRLLKYFR